MEKYRQGELVPGWENLISKFPELLREMIMFSLDYCTKSNKRRMLFQSAEGKKVFAPFVGISQYDLLVKYSQEFYQCAPRNDHGLTQLSLTEEQINRLSERYTIYDLVKFEEARESLFKDVVADEPTRRQLQREIDVLPFITFSTETFAGKEQEQEFTLNDIATFKFKIDRKSPGNPTGIAHLPNFPYLKEEKYYLSLECYGVLVFFEEVTLVPGQTYEAGYNYVHRGAPQPMKFTALLCSDCYFGLDFQQDIELNFVNYTGSNVSQLLSQKIEFHPTDRRIELIPMNPFEAALNMNMGGTNDDEILSDSEETAVAD